MDDQRSNRLRLDSFQLARTMMRLRGRYAPLASAVTDEQAAPTGEEPTRAEAATAGEDTLHTAA